VSTLPPLPPGFTLDAAPQQPDIPPLPEGFTLDQHGPALPGGTSGGNVAPAPDQQEAADIGGIKGKVLGAIESAMNLTTAFTTGLAGQAAGLLGGVAGALSTGTFGTPEAANEIERVATEGAQKSTYQPQSGEAQRFGANVVAPVMEAGAPLMGHLGELGAVHAAAAPAVQAVGDVGRAAQAQAGEAVGAAARKVLPVDPELAKVAKTATELKYPIDVRPDQVIENAKFSKLAGQAAADVPLAGSKTSSNQTNFTRNLIDLINPEETRDRLTPLTFDDAMTRSGEGIGEITRKTPVPLDTTLSDALDELRANALSKGTSDDQRIIGNWIDEIKNKAGDDGVIDGTALREINSEIGEQARANPDNDLGRRLNNLQDVIQDAVERNVADPGDVQRLKDFRRQYAYGKMIEPLVAKTIDGKISPQALMARVTATKRGKYFMARAMGGPIGDLAKVGQLIKEPGSSLTTERGLVYGTGLGAAGYVEPHSAAAAYGAANIYNRLGPKLTRAMVKGREGRLPPPERTEPTLPPPDTLPGAGGPYGGGGAPPEGPLGDLTPDWTTSPGAGGPKPAEGVPPIEPEGLVRPLGEEPPGPKGPRPSTNKAGKHVPLVPGKPGVEETMVAGPKSELAPDEATGRAMQTDDAALARRQQAEKAAAEAQSPAVKQVISEHAAQLKAEETARERARVNAEDAAALERAARETDDPHLQARLLKRASDLRAEEKIPVGEVKEGQPEIKPAKAGKIPVGKATEITPERIEPENPEIPTGEATEITPEYIEADRQWRAEHKLGEQDAQRARDVARAYAIDPQRVEQLAQQFDKSPVRFDREIQNLIEEHHANETQRAAGGGEGNAAAPGADRPAAEAVPANERGEGVRDTGAQGNEPVPATERGAAGEPEPQPGAAVHAANEQPGSNRVPAAGAERNATEAAGGQDTSRAQGQPAVGERNDVTGKPSGARDLRKEAGQEGAKEGGDAFGEDLHAEGGGQQGNVKKKPIWRSPLRDFVSSVKMGKGSPEQWRGLLKNAKGLKADELKWSGLDEYLTLREAEGKDTPKLPGDPNQMDLFGVEPAKKNLVSRAEIENFLDSGGVKISEIQLGGPQAKPKVPEVPEDFKRWMEGRGYNAPEVITENKSWDYMASEMNRLARDARNDEARWNDAINERKARDEANIPPEDGEKSLAAMEKHAQDAVDRFEQYRRWSNLAREYHDATTSEAQARSTKYQNWKVPGGENYREVLLQLASHTDKKFDQSHWEQTVGNESNLMHVRLDDRKDATGRRGLFVQEIQSDWAQKARKQGIDQPKKPDTSPRAEFKPVDELPEGWSYRVNGNWLELLDPEGGVAETEQHVLGEGGTGWTPDREAWSAHAVKMYNDLVTKEVGKDPLAYLRDREIVAPGTAPQAGRPVPNAPYIQKTEAWAGLGIKRILKMAADEGYDFVSFANGEQNAAHYDLRKEVDRIVYDPRRGELKAFDHRGNEVLSEDIDEPSVTKLEEYIGKEPAEKLMAEIERVGDNVEPAYDPGTHGYFSVDEDEGETRHYVTDHNGDPVYDRYGDIEYHDSRREAHAARRNFTVEEGRDGKFYIEDDSGRPAYNGDSERHEFDTREEAEDALSDFNVDSEPGETRYYVSDPDGDMVGDYYDNQHDAERAVEEYQQQHEDEINSNNENGNLPEISGLDLEVGGEGMLAFYDKIIPNVVRNVLKQIGGGAELKMMKLEHDASLNKTMSYNDKAARRLLQSGEELYVKTGRYDAQETRIASVKDLDDFISDHGRPFSYTQGGNYLKQPGFDITPQMKEAVAGGVPMFKEGEPGASAGAGAPNEAPKPLGTPEALDKTLREKFGDKLIDGLQREGVLKYMAQNEEQPEGSRAMAVLHQKAMKPYASLYYDRLTAEQAPGVLMHELGEHYGIVRLLGMERYNLMLDELKDLNKKGDAEVTDAWKHVKERYVDRQGTSFKVSEGDTVFMREVAARLVERSPDQHWVRRLINEIRAFFYQHFGTTMGNRVDSNLIRGLAAAALRKASTGDLPTAIPGRGGQPAPFRPFVPQSEGGSRPPVRRFVQPQQPQP